MSKYEMNNMTANDIVLASAFEVSGKVKGMIKAYNSIIGILSCYGKSMGDMLKALSSHNIYLVDVLEVVDMVMDNAYDINDLDIEILKEELQELYME